jgi:hypothetical protein
MKNMLPIIFLSIVSLAANAQESHLSDVEKFYKTPGRATVGYLIYQNSFGWVSTNKILVMKYIDPVAKDTMRGITFSYTTENSSDKCTSHCEIMIDYDEFARIIQWLESYRWIKDTSDPKMGSLSYVPAKGNFILYLKRRKNDKGSTYAWNNWDFVIQADKYDINSLAIIPYEVATVLDKLKEIQRVIQD